MTTRQVKRMIKKLRKKYKDFGKIIVLNPEDYEKAKLLLT